MAEFVLARACEMSISRREFLRLLPAAVGHAAYETDGEVIAYQDGPRAWRIRLEAMPDLVLGRFRMQRQRVTFEFSQHGAEEIDAFMRRFDLHFARGGG